MKKDYIKAFVPVMVNNNNIINTTTVKVYYSFLRRDCGPTDYTGVIVFCSMYTVLKSDWEPSELEEGSQDERRLKIKSHELKGKVTF